MSMAPIKTSWDLSPLFASDDDPGILAEREKMEEEVGKFAKKWKDREDYLKNPKILSEPLGEYEHLVKNYGKDGKQGFYFSLRTAVDQLDTTLRGKENKTIDFGRRMTTGVQFFELRVAKIPAGLQRDFLEDSGLQPDRHFLEKIFKEAKHNLSEPEEKIMTLKAKTSYGNWVEMVSSMLSKQEREVWTSEGKKEIKPYTEFHAYLRNKDQKVRHSAGQAVDDVAEKLSEVAEHEINSILEYKRIDDELRHFDRPDAARHLSDDIDTEVVDALTSAVTKRFDLSQRYFGLFAKLLGQKKLNYYDRAVEYGKIDKKYGFEASVDLVGRVFGWLDPEFEQIFVSSVQAGQVDVYPKKGKRSGAFCATDLIVLPTYVLLNHTGKLQDVLTIAHEFGHAINYHLMRKTQNALTFNSPLSVAEVASTFMEDFVLEELEKEADEELRLALMVMKLQEDMGTIFRQVALYNFETELHRQFREKGYLSKGEIGEIFKTEMTRQQGDVVEMTDKSANWWVQWEHIRYFFYVYSYASGLLISKSLQAMVREDPKAISKVKEFLAAGSSDSPRNIFKKLGIDITDPGFWEKGIGETERLLDETEKLARKLKKFH